MAAPSPNRLEPILAATRQDLERRRAQREPAELEAAIDARAQRGDRRSLLEALRAPGLSLIAEHKRRSPSAGVIRDDLTLEDVVQAYERAGAAALSVLTESEHFGGALEDLHRARQASTLPILRKDFIVDRYQVAEAFAAGADAILLIVAALEERQLAELQAQALDLGLPALVEVHDAREAEVAVAVGAGLIGVNNRDLTTLEVDPRRTLALLQELPPETTVVAESGFSAPEQLEELEAAGVDAVLIGEALMRAPDVEAACRRLTRHG